MTAYVALLRAVNVGGRQLAMADLKSAAQELDLGSPRTYIASGNLLFTSANAEADLKRRLEARLTKQMGKPVDVMIRTSAELAAATAANPFDEEPANRVAAIFLDESPSDEAIEAATGVAEERMALGRREIYVHYPFGMGRSKLKIPAAAKGTARNMNTVAKLAELAKEME
jgi:uncharacterized protein (DUF1697 family)